MASSLDRVILLCFHDFGLRDSLCFTRRWEARTCADIMEYEIHIIWHSHINVPDNLSRLDVCRWFPSALASIDVIVVRPSCWFGLSFFPTTWKLCRHFWLIIPDITIRIIRRVEPHPSQRAHTVNICSSWLDITRQLEYRSFFVWQDLWRLIVRIPCNLPTSSPSTARIGCLPQFQPTSPFHRIQSYHCE